MSFRSKQILNLIINNYKKHGSAIDLSDHSEHHQKLCQGLGLQRFELNQNILFLEKSELIIDINPNTDNPKKYIPSMKGLDYVKPFWKKEPFISGFIGIIGTLSGTILGFLLS